MKGCGNMKDELTRILDHNWLSVYDCCDPDEYESINEKEEMLKGEINND